MRKLVIVAALSLGSVISYAGEHGQTPAPTITDVYNLLNQQLPPDGDYDGVDGQGNDCDFSVERLAIGEIRVNIMPAWGGFGIFNDGSQKLDVFKQSATGAIQIKIETTAATGGLSETSYGVLDVTPEAGGKVEYTEGLGSDLLKPNPTTVSCTISAQ